MDNKINFTGIQNMGALAYKAVDMRNLRPMSRRYLVAQLFDDFCGKDYTKYRNAVDSCRDVIGENSFPYEPKFIHILTERYFGSQNPPKLMLNFKEIPVNDKTLKLYEFLAKFTKTLKNMKPADYKIAEDFKYGPDGDMFIMDDKYSISNFCRTKDDYFTAADRIYNAEQVKRVASSMNDDIQAKMEKYFDV